MTQRSDGLRLQQFGLLVPLLLGLSACGSSPAVDYRSYTDAELRTFYTATPPATLPTQSSSALGESYTLGGSVQNWNRKAINLYTSPTSATPTATADGQISADGTITLTTPLLSLASQDTTLNDVLKVGTYNYGLTCPLDTLTASKEVKVKVLSVSFVYYIKDIQALSTQTLRPLLSPVPIYGYVEPTKTAAVGSVILVWSPEAFTFQGEKRCLSGSVQTSAPFSKLLIQENTLINVKLERGWNALSEVVISSSYSSEGFNVTQHDWSALPAEALKTWQSKF